VNDRYTCAECGGRFMTDWSEEEAQPIVRSAARLMSNTDLGRAPMADTKTPTTDADIASTTGGSMDRTARLKALHERLDVPLPTIPVAIQRLLDEVRNDESDQPTGYNRVYHRHNR
jgi:hypothetical protein